MSNQTTKDLFRRLDALLEEFDEPTDDARELLSDIAKELSHRECSPSDFSSREGSFTSWIESFFQSREGLGFQIYQGDRVLFWKKSDDELLFSLSLIEDRLYLSLSFPDPEVNNLPKDFNRRTFNAKVIQSQARILLSRLDYLPLDRLCYSEAFQLPDSYNVFAEILERKIFTLSGMVDQYRMYWLQKENLI